MYCTFLIQLSYLHCLTSSLTTLTFAAFYYLPNARDTDIGDNFSSVLNYVEETSWVENVI